MGTLHKNHVCNRVVWQKNGIQEHLNSPMAIHVHKDKTDKLEFRAMGNEFVAANAQRTNIFGTFS